MTDEEITERYIQPAAAAIKERWIKALTDCGVSRAEAERMQAEDAAKIRIWSAR